MKKIKLKKTSFYIGVEQEKVLSQLSDTTDVNISRLIRKAIDLLIFTYAKKGHDIKKII